MSDVSMLVTRSIFSHMDFVTLNFYFEFHTVSRDFNKKNFLILTFLEARRHVRHLYFSLESTLFELNFSAKRRAY